MLQQPWTLFVIERIVSLVKYHNTLFTNIPTNQPCLSRKDGWINSICDGYKQTRWCNSKTNKPACIWMLFSWKGGEWFHIHIPWWWHADKPAGLRNLILTECFVYGNYWVLISFRGYLCGLSQWLSEGTQSPLPVIGFALLISLRLFIWWKGNERMVSCVHGVFGSGDGDSFPVSHKPFLWDMAIVREKCIYYTALGSEWTEAMWCHGNGRSQVRSCEVVCFGDVKVGWFYQIGRAFV